MAELGKRQSLIILRDTVQGLYLDGGALGEILLPRRYAARHLQCSDAIEVFVYRDSEDRLVATTETARAEVGGFAVMRVVSSSVRMGAFLDWGLPKDLLLPNREQETPVRTGDRVVAYVFLDPKSNRIVATTRLDRALDKSLPDYEDGAAVQLMIVGRTPLGYKAIVDGKFWGLLYGSDLAVPLEPGQQLPGYIQSVRPDGKIDLRLDPSGYQRVKPLAEKILEALEAAGGHLPLDDDSSPEAIRKAFQASKKSFKQALGALYRKHRIRFTAPGIAAVAPVVAKQPWEKVTTPKPKNS